MIKYLLTSYLIITLIELLMINYYDLSKNTKIIFAKLVPLLFVISFIIIFIVIVII